ARRLVPRSRARILEVPPLPEPAARADGRAGARDREQARALVDDVPGHGLVADRGLRRWPAPRLGPMDLRDRRGGLAPDRQRTHARLRVGELRLARLRHLDTAVGDVAVAVRVGPVVALDLEGPFVLARGARAGADGRVPPADRLPRVAVVGRVR